MDRLNQSKGDPFMKKKKKKLLISTILLAFIAPFGVTVVSAAELSSVYDSNASIKFEENTDPTNPVDPTNPDNPFEPDNPAQPGTNGPLSIDYASNLDFGTQKITTQDSFYFAKLTKGIDSTGQVKEVPNYVQVTDNTGSNKGWNLQVTQMNDFTNTSTGHKLNGARLYFNGPTVSTLTNSDAGTPTREAQITPEVGQASRVVTAFENQGQGTWVTSFIGDDSNGAESIALSIPGSSTKEAGVYTTTLKWTLGQTPDIEN